MQSATRKPTPTTNWTPVLFAFTSVSPLAVPRPGSPDSGGSAVFGPISIEPRSHVTAFHRRLGTPGRRFAFLLFLLLVCTSLCARAQRAQADALHGSAPQEAPSLTLRSTVDTASLDTYAAVENGGNRSRVIVIGFMGGFAKSNDQKHPEVQFAQYLREQYRSDIHAEVFGNHHGKKALQEVHRLLDGNEDGTLSSAEKEGARIIIYGHSWGATETVVFARELEKSGIPVLLTIQVDSIGKLGRNNSMIPANVAKAINLYQSGGPLHGQAKIFAADPAQTRIIGNLHMTYEGHHINCDNYPWFARTFNKPHHEIENDPRVWTLAASLIDSEVVGTNLTARESASWTCCTTPDGGEQF